MSIIFVFLLMIFMHILDDFGLQKGLLCFMKQKKWWEAQDDFKPLYRFDYIWGLFIHSFSWSFMIMLPIAFVKQFDLGNLFLLVFIFNLIVHALTDNAKTNKKSINLWADQTIHILQIIITATTFL